MSSIIAFQSLPRYVGWFHRMREDPNLEIADEFLHEKSPSEILYQIYHSFHIIFTRHETTMVSTFSFTLRH